MPLDQTGAAGGAGTVPEKKQRAGSLTDLPSIRLFLKRIGAEPRSMRAAVIREECGKYWKDIAVIHFKDGVVDCDDPALLPTDAEAADIQREWGKVEWPQLKPLHRIVNAPDMIKQAEPKNVFEFRDTNGLIVMVQVRIEKDGDKKYIPWTYWDDDTWRNSEPDGKLPLFNADKLKNAVTVFIHEGAKGARHCQWMVEGLTAEARDALAAHPWGQQFRGAAHIGWIGGALNPGRTDWDTLQRQGITRAYIVADNDEPGIAAVPNIAQKLRMVTFSIEFTEDKFPEHFDLADKFPDKLFAETNGIKHYTGPTFNHCLNPATWATDLVPNKQGRPSPRLRDSFRQMWAYVEDADAFVCLPMPQFQRSEKILNNMLAPFSHAAETAKLITRAYIGRSVGICYRPGAGRDVITESGKKINLHIPAEIKSQHGDAGPWLEFLKYLFVKDGERKQVERWCATLIAKPEVRMGYALLLISERQGIGKTTFGAEVLKPLVGHHNVSHPNDQDIISPFNEWVANKRLAIVNEVYAGNSWKAYQTLKSAITDRDVTVNRKYMRQHVIENWCHLIACSNSRRALKMEDEDRRWFYPEMNEEPWSKDKFTEFRRWIGSGGLRIIKHWAESYGDYVGPGEHAPMTDSKKSMIQDSMSKAQREAAVLADALREFDGPAATTMMRINGWVRVQCQGEKVFDDDRDLRKAMVKAGVKTWPKRLWIDKRSQYAVVNGKLWNELLNVPEADHAKFVADRVRGIGELGLQTEREM
jgi:hypothetical protein